ncbi:TonB-dependent receptor [Sphingomonas sp. RB3P16]|uniref:TonB-dependent receptor n=1 Tax=Parasphingomonas frigoris TaxID=3096163 RepID=UPI002FCBEFBF
MHGRILALGAVSVWAIAASSAQAQTALASPPAPTTADSAQAQPEAGDIVVTGIRAGLATALQAKKNATNIQEVLAADDIGKLPDNNIAESLARLPGLSTNRDRGNATQISIRGMGPELVNTLLNGRELVSAGPDRNIRYDQYPAELINGASVYKSPTPGQVEGAIAGQVDLKTIRPLDFKKRVFVVNARAEYNDLAHDVQDAKSVGWIASASYVGQFANDTLGVAIGATARNEPVATERTNIYRYTNSFADLNGDGVGNDNVPYGFEALKRGGSDKRVGALATVQWRPGNGLEVVGDFFYSRVKYAEYQRGFSVQNLPFGNTFSNVTVKDGGAVAGTATSNAYYGALIENNNQYYTFTDNLYAGGLNAKYDADRWHFAGDVGYSKTTRNAMFLNEYTSTVYPGTTYTRTDGNTASYLSRPGQPASFTLGQSLTDQSLNYLTNLEIPSNGNGAPIIHDELYSGKLDAAYDVDSFITTLRAGVRLTSRAKDLTQRTQYGSINQPDRAPIAANLLGSPLTWSGAFAGLPASQTWDVIGVANQYFGGINPTESVSDQNASWEVDEKTYAGFVAADFDHDIGSMKLTGNVGVRVIRTEDTSKGTNVSYLGATAVATPLLYHNNYTDWLPSLNATLHIDSRQQIRFAVSKAIARAPLDNLNPGYSLYTGSSGAPAATGGNPLLQPYRAKQVDLTYEHYFNKDTALTVSLFYKHLDSFIVTNTSALTVGGVTYQDAFTQPVNLTGGNLKGVEVLFQQAFTFLPQPLDGFGIYANYSYTDSSVKVTETDNSIGTIALPGLSKNVYNVSLYYSKSGIDARVGYRYRSAYATQTGDTDRILVNHAEGVLSAELAYEFQDSSPLHGVRLSLQADNLTNTPYQLYYGTQALQGRYETFGRRFYAGATYRF